MATRNNQTTFDNIDFNNYSDSETFYNSELWAQPNFREISVYCALFVVAAVGNLTVLISLFRSRHRKSRISLMITHLAIADLIVTFIMIPLEVGWRLTGRWLAGNVACKVFLFLRVLGPYLSSNIIVCVSLDRYFAVLYPLRVSDARRRGKIMLTVAWSASFIYCIPQSFVFSVKSPSNVPQFTQCVSFDFFTTPSQEIAYNFLCVTFMYFIPLFVIIVAYTAIMCEIFRNSKSIQSESQPLSDGKIRLRRSAVNIEKAKCRTLKMTIIIVAVYIWCCTPYAIITLWYMIDRESAERLPEWIQETFFIMVVTNSCANPIIYGSYIITCKKKRKYVACFDKKQNCINGGSAITKSTGVRTPGTNFRFRNDSNRMYKLEKYPEEQNERIRSVECPPSAARVSFAQSSSSRSQPMSFYSEPVTNPLGFICDEIKLSEPDLSLKTTLVVNVHQAKVQYHHHGYSNNVRKM
ncbi:adipokinetic hormone/corazonin-related peptide receptor variant I-like [Diorhabda sublineata]|uniref:adipokinetic hormone/corazonin-related peptide receptor variant I-like n=1 Tax=Diorhabda sublineata TaxID=1163346 RepID=UPI0024E07BD4|nr:adipokinetic hormone/corazonin-related peptide receptor variant I-like [Diorhabda sublineata]XP_056640775.1 adipokinetic hormone/corazonin-related peptide receptor variant I-like [Diorhabda sublineata]